MYLCFFCYYRFRTSGMADLGKERVRQADARRRKREREEVHMKEDEEAGAEEEEEEEKEEEEARCGGAARASCEASGENVRVEPSQQPKQEEQQHRGGGARASCEASGGHDHVAPSKHHRRRQCPTCEGAGEVAYHYKSTCPRKQSSAQATLISPTFDRHRSLTPECFAQRGPPLARNRHRIFSVPHGTQPRFSKQRPTRWG